LRQAMERVAKLWIDRQGLIVFRNGFREFSFAEKIDTPIVMVFRGFRRAVVHASSLALPTAMPCGAAGC
jgi:hypothetical protein